MEIQIKELQYLLNFAERCYDNVGIRAVFSGSVVLVEEDCAPAGRVGAAYVGFIVVANHYACFSRGVTFPERILEDAWQRLGDATVVGKYNAVEKVNYTC